MHFAILMTYEAPSDKMLASLYYWNLQPPKCMERSSSNQLALASPVHTVCQDCTYIILM